MNSAIQFIRGLSVPFRGFMLVMTSFSLFCLASVPIWVCLAFLVWTIWWFFHNPLVILPFVLKYVPGMQSFVDNLKIGEFSIIDAIMQGLFWVFLIVFASYFSYLLLSLIGAPFYSLMSSRILKRKNVQMPQLSPAQWLLITLKMIVISLLKLVFFVMVGGVLFFFSFLPTGMLIVPLCMCLLIAYDCFDFAFETMTYSIRQRWMFFYSHLPAFMGLSLSILIIGTLPGMFTLALPFFIAGGSELFGDLHLASLPKNPIVPNIPDPTGPVSSKLTTTESLMKGDT